MFFGVVWFKNDNRFVVNIKIRGKMIYELWSINFDGLNLRQLIDYLGRGSVYLSILFDGNWIVFESGRDMDDGEIYLMCFDGSQ